MCQVQAKLSANGVSLNRKPSLNPSSFTVWLYDHDEPVWDPNGILTWMKHELHAAEAAGQRAWISALLLACCLAEIVC